MLKDWKKWKGQNQWENNIAGQRITVGKTSDGWIVSRKEKDSQYSFHNISKEFTNKSQALAFAKKYMRLH